MSYLPNAFALAPFLLTLACGGGSPAGLPPGLDPGTQLALVRLDQSGNSFASNSGLRTPTRTVVRTPDEWATMWAQLVQPSVPPPPAPTIDFAQEMVIIAALGERPSGGHAITITRVSEAGDGSVDVVVQSRSPGTTCITTSALTQPVDVVRVPRRDGPVRYWEQSERKNC
jgi:hypothetical protein